MINKLRIFSSGLPLLIIVLFISGCEIINPPEPVPAYIYIPSFTLDADTLNQGSNAHGITDAWVYVDDNLQGLYELPATFPILLSGSQKIVIRAGIKNNGAGSTRIYYPFYTTYETTVDLEPNVTDTIRPVVQYRSNVNFPFLENFESGNSLRVNKDRSTVDTLYRIQDPNRVFEGKFSVLDDLPNGGNQYNEFESANDFPLPDDATDIMLEFNFKTNVPFEVGYVIISKLGTNTTVIYNPVVTMNPTEGEWKKIYVDLREDVAFSQNTNNGINTFRVFFRTANSDDSIDPEVYLDNIKLLHFE